MSLEPKKPWLEEHIRELTICILLIGLVFFAAVAGNKIKKMAAQSLELMQEIEALRLQTAMCPRLTDQDRKYYQKSLRVSQRGVDEMAPQQFERFKQESRRYYLRGIAGLKALELSWPPSIPTPPPSSEVGSSGEGVE